MSEKRRVLIIGAGFSGLFAARDLKRKFNVTVIDCKEYFEYTPGILRCYVDPNHFKKLSFLLQPVLEQQMGVKFLWGEVLKLHENRATVKLMFNEKEEDLSFDYCIVASGCNFGPFHPTGESLWFPTVHEESQKESDWKHLDERYLAGRRRHILEEHSKLARLNSQKARILIVGAGFIGVELVTELEHFFPNLDLTIIDFLPRPLGPLPESAASYCQKYMEKKGIKTVYNTKYDPESPEFWQMIGLPNGADETYVCIGVKASNYFIDKEYLSTKGPGGGGWILINKRLQITDKSGHLFGGGNIFAVGDCNFGCVEGKQGFDLPPIPKISYPAEEQALHCVKYIKILDNNKFGSSSCKLCIPTYLRDTWWPWGAGMFATSLGPKDACFVLGANEEKGSGITCFWKGRLSSIQKDLIESTKVNECKNGCFGKSIWYFVHHKPFHLWGRGPLINT